MAVTVTDNRTIIDEADGTTGWTGSLTVFTSDPNPVEAGGSLGLVVSSETEYAYFTMGSSVDMSSGMLVYVWVLANGAMDTTANGGVQLLIGDGTNRIGFHLAGSDKAGFRHADGPVGWQCLVLDTAALPAASTAESGSLGSLDLSAITQVGAGFKTLLKSVGGVSNCWIDIMRYGNGGLTITGGTEGDPGKFSEIAALDRATTNQRAHGIIRELAGGLYGLQGPLTFGNGATATHFADTDAVVVFEDRGLSNDKYGITVQGSGTTFILGTKTGSGDAVSGTNGVTISAPSGTNAALNLDDADLTTLSVYGSTLVGFDQGIGLSTTSSTPEFYGNQILKAGQTDLGIVDFRNVSFADSGLIVAGGALFHTCLVSGATGPVALLWDVNVATNSRLDHTTFSSGGTGHAIELGPNTPATISLFAVDFIGYGANGTTDAAIYNNSGKAIEISILGNGTEPTIRNGTDASTTVITGQRNLSFTVESEAGDPLTGYEWRLYEASVTPGTLGTTELDGEESATLSEQNYPYSYTVDTAVVLQVMHSSYIEAIIRFTLIDADRDLIVVLQPEENI